MDHVTVLELDIGDKAADPGANLNLLHRLEAAGELVPIRDRALDRRCDGDRRRCGGSLLLRLLAGGQGRSKQEQQSKLAERRTSNQGSQKLYRAHVSVPPA